MAYLYGRHVQYYEAYMDFIVFVMLRAPNNFLREDFLKADEQPNLEDSFFVLNEKFELVRERIPIEEVAQSIKSLLEMSLDEYRIGEKKKGAHLLQEFETQIRAHAGYGVR